MRTRRRVLAATALSISGVAGCLDDGLDELPGMGGREETEQQDQRRDVLLGYEDALEERNDGILTLDQGIDLFNAEAYADAIDEMETALDRFAAAADGFETAADAAAEIDTEDPAVEEAEAIPVADGDKLADLLGF